MAAVSDIQILSAQPLLSPVDLLSLYPADALITQTVLSAHVGITDAPGDGCVNFAATEILLKYAHDSLA
jgi:hypothetical protein